MKYGITGIVLLATAAFAVAQPEVQPIPPRYGVPALPDVFPQVSSKELLVSALRAVERGKFDYLAAHLLDPQFVDDRVGQRAVPLEGGVDRDLRAERASQRANPIATLPEYRIPDDPRLFDLAVRAEARNRAFKLVVKDIRDNLTEHPDHLNDFRKILREGQFVDAGDSASANVKDLKDRQMFFRRIEGRWFVENRQLPDVIEKK